MADFNQLAAEAERRFKRKNIKDEPYVLKLNDSEAVVIEYPRAGTALTLSRIPESETLLILNTLFDGNPAGYNRFMEAVKDHPVEIIQAITEDMYSHWNLSNKVPGKSELED